MPMSNLQSGGITVTKELPEATLKFFPFWRGKKLKQGIS